MDLEIIYSNRKTLSITVREGRVIVRAPKSISRSRIDSFVDKNREWIKKRIEITKNQCDPIAAMTDAQVKQLRESARVYLTAKTEEYAKIMGLKYSRITITGAKTRFGSCSSKGNISYSYRLMLYPEEAIDYVVVHELAHLVEMNHSRRFYAIVEKILPDYKERIKLLKCAQ